jgi:hypothetical protein
MPNFQTHWVVAWEALKGLPGRAANGRKAYGEVGRAFARKLREAVLDVKTMQQAAALRTEIGRARGKWAEDLASSASSASADPKAKAAPPGHDVACFSAFMLGAVGPDFWMVPADNSWASAWDSAMARAPNYFNLGHYNRAHEQFRRSFIGIRNGKGVQADVERSYFCGMATHIAADLFIHQFVNTTAGAYNELQESYWTNEHGMNGFYLWNLHNKVEQYLDSYMRYRFLGDLTEVEPVFGERELNWFTGNDSGGFKAAGLPLIETLLALARRNPDAKVRKALLDVLGDEEVRIQVERPLIFPAIFCDRVLEAGASPPFPFIYKRVVSRGFGAYSKYHVREKLLGDATSSQMESPSGGYSEEKKLRFFSSDLNESAPLGKAWNYLAYRVGPSLDRIRQRSDTGLVNGLDRFYDLSAMQHYGARAVELAKAFAKEVEAAYPAGEKASLPKVGRFWNLDTGNGLEVQGLPAETTREVVTRLDFLHVLDERVRPGSALPYYRSGDAAKVRHLTGKQASAEDHSAVEHRAFPIVSPPPRFASMGKVAESDAKTFLDRIRVGPERAQCAPRLLSETLDEFFTQSPGACTEALEVETKFFGRQPQVSLQEVKHRLTIELRISVPDFGRTADEPAMFFACDEATWNGGAADAATHKWLHGKAKPIDFVASPRGAGALRQFTARILTNLEPETELKRVLKAGTWNNVVPWKENKRFYGRNFAIGTGRRFVIRAVAKGGGSFFKDPPLFTKTTTDANLYYFTKAFPTEHTFFTLYPLVRALDGKVYDAFSKVEVERKEFDDVIRKVHGVGWMKVVLLYVLRPGGAAQLDRCFVDAIETPVVLAYD